MARPSARLSRATTGLGDGIDETYDRVEYKCIQLGQHVFGVLDVADRHDLTGNVSRVEDSQMSANDRGRLAHRVAMLAVLVVGLLAVGCPIAIDPVRRVEQSVVLRVSLIEDVGAPSNVSIAVREHEALRDAPELDRLNPKWREQMYPWTHDVKTDELGRASIVYGVTMLDGSRGNVPPKSRYPLEGHVFIVRITGADGTAEELKLDMVEGATVEGRSDRITVERITEAVYVNPNRVVGEDTGK